MEISQYTWSRQTVRKRWVSFEPFTPMEFLCQSASDPTSHIENQNVQSQLDVEDALSNVFESNAAGVTRGICRGIQVDGLDSLPLGRGKFPRFFKYEEKGWGNTKFCKIMDGNHGNITTFPRQITECKIMIAGQTRLLMVGIERS